MAPGNRGRAPTLVLSEAAVAEEPSNGVSYVSDSRTFPSYGSHNWADLLDNMLHQIIALLSSFHDFLAFSCTCRSWRDAASSFPAAYTFAFPPVHHKPYFSHEISTISSYREWQLVNPAKRNIILRCSPLRNTSKHMQYLGCSYGYFIFYDRKRCILVDVHTGIELKTPNIKSGDKSSKNYGIITAPLSSPNSDILLCSRISMFQWKVGTNSWTEYPLFDARIQQIVFFKGQMFALDYTKKLHIIRLAPNVSMHEVEVMWEEDTVLCQYSRQWLVVCGDMLLLVHREVSVNQVSATGYFQVFRLELSMEPAKWVKMEKLENWAIFISLNGINNPTFSCVNPERWGGKSNCVYLASADEDSDEPWTTLEFGSKLIEPHSHSYSVDSLWLVPSLVYSVVH